MRIDLERTIASTATQVAAIALTFLAGCEPNDSSKGNSTSPAETLATENTAAHVAMLSNPNRSMSDFQRQLRESLRNVGGVLLLDNPLNYDVSVMPPNSQWVVQCGVGIKIVFGTALSTDGDGSGVHNDTEIQLSLVPMPREQCKEVAPLIGHEIQTILLGNGGRAADAP